jgi:hypothetical protein
MKLSFLRFTKRNVQINIVAMENLDNVQESQFKVKLHEIYNAAVKTVLIKKEDYSKLIEELKDANRATSKNRRQYYILSRYVIIKKIYRRNSLRN